MRSAVRSAKRSRWVTAGVAGNVAQNVAGPRGQTEKWPARFVVAVAVAVAGKAT